MHFVYIIHSESLDQFYIGESHDVFKRMEKHNEDQNTSSTSKGKPWVLKGHFKTPNRSYALKVEKFIKQQKSRKFIESLISEGSLKKFPLLKQLDC